MIIKTYLKIIEFCLDKDNGVTYKNIVEGLNLNNEELGILDLNIFKAYNNNASSIFIMKEINDDSDDLKIHFNDNIKIDIDNNSFDEVMILKAKKDKYKYYLSFDAISNYSKYKDQKNNKKGSNFPAISALIVSIITMCVIIFFTIQQLNNPMEINKKEIDYIIKLDKKNSIIFTGILRNINKKLDAKYK